MELFSLITYSEPDHRIFSLYICLYYIYINSYVALWASLFLRSASLVRAYMYEYVNIKTPPNKTNCKKACFKMWSEFFGRAMRPLGKFSRLRILNLLCCRLS